MTAKRKKPFAANAASLRHLRNAGYLCGTVEKWIPFKKIRQDLFNFIDIIAIDNGADLYQGAIIRQGAIGVQTTTASHVAARRDKILGLNAARVWMQRGNTIWIHAWTKKPGKKPSLVVHEIRLEDFE